jgi:hypothetical protein
MQHALSLFGLIAVVATSPALAQTPFASPSLSGSLRQRVDAWQARRHARREFHQYLASNPLARQIFDEECKRETVAVAECVFRPNVNARIGSS